MSACTFMITKIIHTSTTTDSITVCIVAADSTVTTTTRSRRRRTGLFTQQKTEQASLVRAFWRWQRLGACEGQCWLAVGLNNYVVLTNSTLGNLSWDKLYTLSMLSFSNTSICSCFSSSSFSADQTDSGWLTRNYHYYKIVTDIAYKSEDKK